MASKDISVWKGSTGKGPKLWQPALCSGTVRILVWLECALCSHLHSTRLLLTVPTGCQAWVTRSHCRPWVSRSGGWWGLQPGAGRARICPPAGSFPPPSLSWASQTRWDREEGGALAVPPKVRALRNRGRGLTIQGFLTLGEWQSPGRHTHTELVLQQVWGLKLWHQYLKHCPGDSRVEPALGSTDVHKLREAWDRGSQRDPWGQG